jgi:very-short-patch-repair endonuclease
MHALEGSVGGISGWEERERGIRELARRQDNVITHEQVTAVGLGRGAIAHRLATSRWQRLHKGIYLIGAAPAAHTARARAAVLACGDEAVVSHTTAAAIWGLMPAGHEIHVTVPGRNPGRRPGIQTHRANVLAPDEVANRTGIPVTSPARTICDVAGYEHIHDTEHALAEARVQGLVSDRQLATVIERAPTLKGSAVIRALLDTEDESGYTRSRAERAMVELTRSAGLPRPILNQPLLGYVVDFLWPQHRLVVEVDGYKYHRHRARFESDRKRDQVMVSAGYRVLRVTWRQLRDEPLFVAARLAQAMTLSGLPE